MKEMSALHIVLVIGIVLSLAASEAGAAGGWVIYWDGSYHGKVIDAEMKEPIEGTVVIAIYHESCYRFIQTNSKVIGVQEVSTGPDGNFRIPAFWIISTPDCWYSYTDFLVFKPGHGTFPPIPTSFALSLPTRIYSPENPKLEKKDIYTIQEMFRTGVVVELPRLKTKEEMANYHISSPVSTDRLNKKLSNFHRLEKEFDNMRGYK